MSLCGQIHRMVNDMERLRFPFDKARIPRDGIYILFEKGETGHGGDRIVRIGTHTGEGQLPPRLRQHFLQENKDRSIFRKNIGRAILHRDRDPLAEQWEWDLTSRKAKDKYGSILDRDTQKETEKRVSEHIQSQMSFVVFSVPNKADRLFWESRIISTVSRCDSCGPGKQWLGQHSPKNKIRESGLWLVNELYKEPLSGGEFNTLSSLIKVS